MRRSTGRRKPAPCIDRQGGGCARLEQHARHAVRPARWRRSWRQANSVASTIPAPAPVRRSRSAGSRKAKWGWRSSARKDCRRGAGRDPCGTEPCKATDDRQRHGVATPTGIGSHAAELSGNASTSAIHIAEAHHQVAVMAVAAGASSAATAPRSPRADGRFLIIAPPSPAQGPQHSPRAGRTQRAVTRQVGPSSQRERVRAASGVRRFR